MGHLGREMSWPPACHILFVDKKHVLELEGMAVKREAAWIIAIYIIIICLGIGSLFHSQFDKSELVKNGVWVNAGDGGGVDSV